mmetsp:Transcript_65288/g.75927  ORF Transcript_65288/g.75927 Transcript_65288/m.75927 type:complete len:219 (+) Transcript_65288:3-659(+)
MTTAVPQPNLLQGMRSNHQQQTMMQNPQQPTLSHQQLPLQHIPIIHHISNVHQLPNGHHLHNVLQKLPLQGFAPQAQLQVIQKPVQLTHPNNLTHTQNLSMLKPQEIQRQTSENLNEGSDLYHLTEKKMDRVPLEAQPDKDYLYFAVIDTKTHEIYVMNQVTQANYDQTLDALSADKPEEVVPNSSQPNNLELALSQEPEFPEYTFSRKTSDFLFEDK